MVQSKILSKYTNLFHYFSNKDDSSNLAKFGIKTEYIKTCEQIHSNKVSILKNGKIKFVARCDGIITNKPFILGIRTADCLPIFFYDPKNKMIAAVHAGWKGLCSGIIKNTINTMRKLGCDPGNIKVSVGPHIQVCCYNVPKARIDEFRITNTSDRLYLLSDNISKWRKGSWYLDLGNIAHLHLKSLGITNSNIEISDTCTSCDRNYWSFRRDGKKSGRMLNIIGLIG